MSRRLCRGGAALFFLFLLLAVGWVGNTKAYAASPTLTLNLPAITAIVGRPWSGTIATGTDSLAGDTLTSTIEWDDGSQSHPNVTLAQNGTFQIQASHTFTVAGTFLFQVSVTSATSTGIAKTATVTITNARLTLKISAITAIVGRAWHGTIATGTDSLAGDTLTSTIEWGDGSQSHPDVTLAQNGTFRVHVSHTFTIARSFPYQVSVTSATNSGVVETATVTVTNARLTLKISAITATVGKPWSGTVVTGTDSLAGDKLTSTIEWGDGSQSHPTVTLTKNGTFQIRASHTFTVAGSFPYQVSVTSATNSGVVETAPVTVTAAKALKLGNPCIFIQSKAAFLIVTFSDNQEQTKVADYKATINWGDGTTVEGTIWNNWSSKDFLLLGKHQYKHHGTFTITLTITGPGNSNSTKTKTIVV